MTAQEHDAYIPEETAVKPDLDRPEITLVNDNPILLDIVHRLPFIEPIWEEICFDLEEKSRHNIWAQRELHNASMLKGQTGEAWLEQAVEELWRTSEWKDKVNITPIREDIETEHYRVVEIPARRGHVTVTRKPEGNRPVELIRDMVIDYDRVITINLGDTILPVVFEIKLENRSKQQRNRGNQRIPSSPGNKGRSATLYLDNIRKKLIALQELFQTNEFGYVVIFPQERFHPEQSPVQQEFIEQSGILLPFPVDNATLAVEALRMFNYFRTKA